MGLICFMAYAGFCMGAILGSFLLAAWLPSWIAYQLSRVRFARSDTERGFTLTVKAKNNGR